MNDILTEKQIKELKNILGQVIDVGMKNFKYGVICNRKVNNKVVGFEGQGETDGFATLNMLNSVWTFLSDEEKEKIQEVLNANE